MPRELTADEQVAAVVRRLTRARITEIELDALAALSQIGKKRIGGRNRRFVVDVLSGSVEITAGQREYLWSLALQWRDRMPRSVRDEAFDRLRRTVRRLTEATEAMATGTIKRMVRDRGFGFLRAESGEEYFFHRSAVTRGSFDEMSEGVTRVTFEAVDGPKGPRAEDVRIAGDRS